MLYIYIAVQCCCFIVKLSLCCAFWEQWQSSLQYERMLGMFKAECSAFFGVIMWYHFWSSHSAAASCNQVVYAHRFCVIDGCWRDDPQTSAGSWFWEHGWELSLCGDVEGTWWLRWEPVLYMRRMADGIMQARGTVTSFGIRPCHVFSCVVTDVYYLAPS